MKTLDPRTKLALLLIAFVVIILTPSTPLLLTGSAWLILVIAARGRLGAWLRVMRGVALLALFLVLFYWWAFDGPTALLGALRLGLSVSIFWYFFQTTPPEDLANALTQSGVPYAFAFILTAAMQFAPVLSRRARNILDAQRARGIRLELDLASARNLPALLVPLLIQSFALAEQLAEALEARGFGSPQRTRMREFQLRGTDYFVVLGGLVLGSILVWWSTSVP